MLAEPLVFAATSDLAGKTRGKSFAVAHSVTRDIQGVGWTPSNVQITCFDTIAKSPYGSFGDLLLKPDPAAEDPGSIGNGVHIHMSFLNPDGTPATYSETGVGGLSLQNLRTYLNLTIE